MSTFLIIMSIASLLMGGANTMFGNMQDPLTVGRAGVCFILSALLIIAAGVWR